MKDTQKYIAQLERTIAFRIKSIEFAETQEQIDYAKNEIKEALESLEYFNSLVK